MIARTALAALLVPAAASADITEIEYLCDDFLTISALYLTERDPQIVVIEGDLVLLAMRFVPELSDARDTYLSSDGNSSYIWRPQGDGATLTWGELNRGIVQDLQEWVCIAVTN